MATPRSPILTHLLVVAARADSRVFRNGRWHFDDDTLRTLHHVAGGAFFMTGEGVGRLFTLGLMNEGPFPEHYEPFESPLDNNPMHPKNPKAKSNPAARVYKGDMEAFGTAKDFPYVATTYRLTEHFHYWTKQSKINAIMQPEQFVEIGEELAKEKGIAVGDKVKIRSNRGFIKAVAVVTKV